LFFSLIFVNLTSGMITNPLLIGSTTSDPACGACAARSWTDDVGACGLAAAVAAPATNRHADMAMTVEVTSSLTAKPSSITRRAGAG